MKPLIEQWHFDPLIILLIAGITYLYYLVTGFKSKNLWCFLPALSLFVLAECSPLHTLGMQFFSAHMIVHIVELLICGPLLVISLAPQNISPLYSSILALSSFFANRSWLAWFCGVGIMWFWHIPVIFDGAIKAMHSSFSVTPVLQGGTMLLAGMLFSWPIFGPFKSTRLKPLSGIVYLFTACISCSLLGLLITFAPLNTWQHYQMDDQQAAGLVMWVPCCFIYLSGCLYLLYGWFSEADLSKKNINNRLNTPITNHE